jgi:iron complex outermembrane receptor protein
MRKGMRSFMGVILGGFILGVMPGISQAQEEVVKIGEVVVSATRSEKDIADVPAAVNVVTKQEIEKRKMMTVDQSLNVLPGVFNRRGKGLMDSQSSISLRGIPNANRTLILKDGIPLNNAYTGDVHWGALAPEDMERIEVVKGPFSSLYGGNAMGGVVNIITKMPEKREFMLKAGF